MKLKNILAVLFLTIELVSSIAEAKHKESDYNISANHITYKELVAYIDSVGWDQVYYSYVTGVGMVFVKGQVKVGQGPKAKLKNTIFYYWKALKIPVNGSGNAWVDDASLRKAQISGGAANSPYAKDLNDKNMIFDMQKINSGAANANDKVIGFRLFVFGSSSSTYGTIGQVDNASPPSVQIFPGKSMAFKFVSDKKSNQQMGLLVDSGATGHHLLDQVYPIKNYDINIHNASKFEVLSLK